MKRHVGLLLRVLFNVVWSRGLIGMSPAAVTVGVVIIMIHDRMQ